MRKKVTEFFQYHQLKVTVDINLIQTDFLYVTLNLSTGRYWPYRKPNDQPLYINVQSNHPPLITKKLPCMIVKRISKISCDVDAFNRSLPVYEQALEQNGHKIQPLSFERAAGRKKFRQRRRKVIWFNPPYNNRVSTNIGKSFFYLLRKPFPPSNKLHKTCNKNVVKLSYSCTPNMANILAAHNKRLLKSHNGKSESKPCNCRYKPSCPLNGNCCDMAIVFIKRLFKPRINLRTISDCAKLNLKRDTTTTTIPSILIPQRNATELSKFIWSCKRFRLKSYYILKNSLPRHTLSTRSMQPLSGKKICNPNY